METRIELAIETNGANAEDLAVAAKNTIVAPTCAIGGVFSTGRGLAACGQHGGGNRCCFGGECEHKRVPNVQGEQPAANETNEG